MSIIIDDKGVLAALLDEAEDYMKDFKLSEDKRSLELAAEKSAKHINRLTDKAAELIEEKTEEELLLSFSVSLPPRYTKTVEKLDALNKKINQMLDKAQK